MVTDVNATFLNDPAARNFGEVIFCYPAIRAITNYRMAHKLLKLKVPLILVGGNRSFQVAERLINEGTADYISMSRPLIREPDLINRWRAGDLSKAACLSDNMCFRPAQKGQGIYCLTEEREKKK